MTRQDLHAHCAYDDGHASPGAMLAAGAAQGLAAMGLSLHVPLPFACAWAADARRQAAFCADMAREKRAWAGCMAVYTGAEWDVQAPQADLTPFDYVIGSAHFVPLPDGTLAPVDESPQATADALARGFHGDAAAMAAAYFAEVARVAQRPEVDIAGHVDLLTKFDERCAFFQPSMAAWLPDALRALEALTAAGKYVEVNTGAISRGWRSTPYPSRALLTALRRMGGRVTISSDAHRPEHVAQGFAQAEALLRDCGFTAVWQLVVSSIMRKFQSGR